MIRIENLSRRGLLKGATAGSVLLLGFYIDAAEADPAPAEAKKNPPVGEPPPTKAPEGTLTPNVFISLESTGAVTFTITRSEMGQGIRTSFAMLMADEMAAAWPRCLIKQADGDPKYGDQDTDSSRSMRLMFKPLRQAGATVRQMLEAAAAQTWRAAIVDCRAVDHEVIHLPTGRVLTFGQLAKAASALPIPNPEKLRLQDASSRRYVGHILPAVDQGSMLRGKALYGADITLPGMRFASIERCPVYGGKVKSFDSKAALSVRGVEQVIEIPASALPSGHLPLGGVAVVANNTWSAMEGRRKLQVEWDLGPNATHDSTAYRGELEVLVRRSGKQVRSQGNFDTIYAGAAKKIVGEYFVPYYSQAMMETPVAVGVMENGRLFVFAPTQNPQGARTVLAQYLGMKDAEITVRPTLLGNGYGRKGMHDFICETGWLARKLNQPVKVSWTREDDIRHGYYHPICAQRLDGGLDKNGQPIAWRHRIAFPSLNSTFQADANIPDAAQLGQGMTDMPYAVPNIRCEVASVQAHVRLAPFRAGLNIPQAFAVCSFIDELAQAAGKDPAAYLFGHLAGPRKLDLKAIGVDYTNCGASIEEFPYDIGRLQNVLQYVMDRSGWGDPLLPRQGRGIAIHRSFLSYAACVVVVTVGADGQITIPRVDIALDCGQIINPDRVRAMLEDAVVFGIGLAFDNGQTFKNGVAIETNFDVYKVPRIDAAPETHVHVLPSTQPPGGATDAAVPVIAPAICNAIFAATGKRIRALPIDTNLLKDETAAAPATAPDVAPDTPEPGSITTQVPTVVPATGN